MRLVFRAISLLLCSAVLIGTPDDQKKSNLQNFSELCAQRDATKNDMDFWVWSNKKTSRYQRSIRAHYALTKEEIAKKIMQARQDVTHMKLPNKTN